MRRLSEAEKSEIWDRFEAGESQRSISRRLGRSPSTIRTHLVGSGFRRPVSGPEWSSLQLSLTEREEISRGVGGGRVDEMYRFWPWSGPVDGEPGGGQ